MKQKTIQEICLIRLVLIVLLVLYHSFAPFCGKWSEIDTYNEYPTTYWWIGNVAYSFMLECFTFISGWLYGVQLRSKNPGSHLFSNLLVKKTKRLIIPSVIFSIIYILIFDTELLSTPIPLIKSIVEGYGHMWYLPMLFWCFLGTFLVEKIGIKPIKALILFFILSMFSFIQLPIRLNYTMQYMFFFYGGYLIGKEAIDIRRCISPKYIYICILAYVIIFIFTQQYLMPFFQLYKNESIEIRVIGNCAVRVFRLLYSWLGTFSLVLLSMYIVNIKSFNLKPFWIKISTLTFGVYIFQQFILVWLYYHTKIVSYISSTIIPWIAFILTLVISLILTRLLRLSKIGRLLIG